MDDINSFAIQQAEAAAARLWAFGSAPYPFSGGALIQRHIEQEVTNTAIAFAIHVRRILDNKAVRTKFVLDEPFRIWSPTNGLTKVNLLRDALNRIIHATEFKVGFEKLPDDASKIRWCNRSHLSLDPNGSTWRSIDRRLRAGFVFLSQSPTRTACA